MKRGKKYFLLFLIFCLSLMPCACSDHPDNVPESTGFSAFIDELWREEVNSDTLTLNYSLARPQDFGITPCEVTFGHYSQQEINASVNDCREQLELLKTFRYEKLTAQEQLIYDCVLCALEKSIQVYSYAYYAEPLGPTTGLQAELPIVLAEYHFYTRQDIDTYLALLKCLPDYFREIEQYEREKSAAGFFMTDTVAEDIIRQCKTFIQNPEHNLLIECFDSRLENFDELTHDEVLLYQEQNREAVLNYVIPSYEHLIATLDELKGTAVHSGGLSSLPDGSSYFEAMVQYQTGSSMTIKQMQKRLTQAVRGSLMSMSAAQLTDPELYNRYLSLEYPTNDPVEGLEHLKQAIKTDFPALDDVNYTIKYVHKSLQEHLSPAMYLIPAFDDRQTNLIYINQNPKNDTGSLYTTLAHEGYPGHLYQNNYYLSTNPAPILHLLRTRGYTEGWGTYAELYGYRLAGFDDLLTTFLQDNMTAILCLYGLTEIGIHADGWDNDRTVSFWAEYGIDADTAAKIYNTVLSEPGVYLPYCVGYLEFCDLREEAKKELGDQFSLLDFHTFLLNIGPAPFDIIEKYMKTELWHR